jgi:negative regulator of sigma E activity
MNKENYQKISQFLDAELHHKDLDILLQEIKLNPEIKKTITRYQIASHVMSAEESVVVANKGFLDQINQQLKQEPHYLLPKHKAKKRRLGVWQKTSMALAASVAVVAVLVSQQVSLQHAEAPQKEAIIFAKKPAAKINIKIDREESLNPQLSQHERLKAYLQAHNDGMFTYDSSTSHPYGQVASFSAK